ncbi:hypothetical protein HDU96_003552, partial [Phlyctochytrium bullatum]
MLTSALPLATDIPTPQLTQKTVAASFLTNPDTMEVEAIDTSAVIPSAAAALNVEVWGGSFDQPQLSKESSDSKSAENVVVVMEDEEETSAAEEDEEEEVLAAAKDEKEDSKEDQEDPEYVSEPEEPEEDEEEVAEVSDGASEDEELEVPTEVVDTLSPKDPVIDNNNVQPSEESSARPSRNANKPPVDYKSLLEGPVVTKKIVRQRKQPYNEKGERVYCVCRKPDNGKFMIQCDTCKDWYHGSCIGITEKAAKNIDSYECDECQEVKKENEALLAQ